jgi:hypothetical protein
MLTKILGEPKYVLDTETGQLVNRVSGNPIPTDEPVIVFRAQDALLPDMLASYITRCTDREHKLAAAIRLAEILDWQASNPLRVKQPDTVIDEHWAQVKIA